jgi:thiol-disulfide isomerase/thioredoxin
VEFVRALESHLEKFPKTEKRVELERALARAAIENRDARRIILYGERVLEREPDDLQFLERVARELLDAGGRDEAQRALGYAKHFAKTLGEVPAEKSASARARARLREEIEGAGARALVLQARATGSLGKIEEAVTLARRSFDSIPSLEAAREAGRWLAAAGRPGEAIRHYADAFTIPDARATESDRALARARMGELYSKLHGSEKGLGDIVLDAFDRNTTLVRERRLRARQEDPNAELTDPMQFTLSGIDGEKLQLATLRGKVLILDFWATWCGPCRAQYPMYEEVKRRFRERNDVVFLAISTDEDRTIVADFLKQNDWKKSVWFEDGLSVNLRVSQIPTTIVFNKRGEIVSRLNGFVPDRFVEMLSERIEQTLAQ